MKASTEFIENYYFPETKDSTCLDAFHKAKKKWVEDKKHDPPYSSLHSMRTAMNRQK